MKYGISLPPFAGYAEPRYLAQIAREAEQAGWDGFFLWDHLAYSPPVHPLVDPWIALAAIAMTTDRLHIGPMVTSLARRRPWKVARETVALDRLSGGRFIMGVGLGSPAERDFGTFGEENADRVRAAKLDEGLAILDGLWRGEPFAHHGEYYTVKESVFLPTPLQQPRIPVWVGGGWDKRAPLRRAARWDGYFPLKWRGLISVTEWREIIHAVEQERGANPAPFDYIQGGTTPGDDPAQAAEIVAPFAEIGLTWWIENLDPWRYGLGWEDAWTPDYTEQMNNRIRQGPPRI
jgi:alkanesulfonate monooxygenase SsuD/methylene tetrahydromethanopterin reductase-like flavin-dependent oxidoreductase (luciferase family)